jgi:hypothetical protein
MRETARDLQKDSNRLVTEPAGMPESRMPTVGGSAGGGRNYPTGRDISFSFAT